MANNPVIERALAQARKNEKYLVNAAETAKTRLERSLRELERRIIEEAAKLGAGQKSFGLTQAQKLHGQLTKLFKDTYGEEVQDHVRGFKKVAAMAKKYYEPFPEVTDSFASLDKEYLKALEQQTVSTLAAFGQEAQNRIAQALYNSAVAGRPFGRLMADIEGALTGHVDVRGRPLSQYAGTHAQDSLMETYAAAHQQTAQQAGLTSYLYFGTAVGDSRPFCLARMGKVFTSEEVQGWESLDWAGKKPGPILLVRGGWNCRHQLLPVEPEWIDEDLDQYLGKEEVHHPSEGIKSRSQSKKKTKQKNDTQRSDEEFNTVSRDEFAQYTVDSRYI